MKYLLILALMFLLYQMIKAGIRNNALKNEISDRDRMHPRTEQSAENDREIDYGTIRDARYRDVERE